MREAGAVSGVTGVYGDKVTSLARFAAGFRRLSPACQKRLTVEVCSACMRAPGVQVISLPGLVHVRLVARE